MALDWQAVESEIAGQVLGRRVVYVPVTGSTNDDARRLAAAGEPEGTAIVTDEQTAGRGRAGKSRWLTPPGTSIAVSVLLRPTLRPAELPALSMVAGLAAVEAVHEVIGLSATLKWPNDVMVSGRKLGGILVESALSGQGVAYAIVGIGLNGNVSAASLGPLPDAAVPATSLMDQCGVPVSREALLVALLRALDRHYAAVCRRGVVAVLAPYRAALGMLGRPVRVHGAGVAGGTSGASGSQEWLDGTAEDVTRDGALVLRLRDGSRRAFSHGEVTVRER